MGIHTFSTRHFFAFITTGVFIPQVFLSVCQMSFDLPPWSVMTRPCVFSILFLLEELKDQIIGMLVTLEEGNKSSNEPGRKHNRRVLQNGMIIRKCSGAVGREPGVLQIV